MTTANEGLAGTTAAARTPLPAYARPARTAQLVLLGVIAANLVVIEVLYWTGDLTKKNALVWIGQFLGLHLAFVMALQLVLVARLPWLDRRIGMDRLTSWHRLTGFTLFWAVVAHASLIISGFAVLDKASPLTEFTSLAGVPASLLG